MDDYNDLILQFDAFVRSFKQNKDVANSFLIGAGASISSGIQSATDCLWEWKKDIYCSNNDNVGNIFQNYKTDTIQKIIQEWLDKQGIYPIQGDENEYSFYAEQTYPIEEDRVKYFKNLSKDKAPYIGYKLLCLLNKFGVVKSVWSTNFDGLVPRAAHQLNITPIEINLDNEGQIFRNSSDSELLYIALHGDYKYSKLKNTSNELDNQSEIFSDKLKHYFVDKNLIVCGYSGRDKSLMDALLVAFKEKGSGRVYWCGYGDDIPINVRNFLLSVRQYGRKSYYISTDGFDKTMISLVKACVENDKEKIIEVDKILQSFSQDELNITAFQINNTDKNKYIKSNLYPVKVPLQTFVLDIEYNEEEKSWRLLKDLIRHRPIIAVPYKNKVYAFSSLNELKSVFYTRLKDNIRQEPISVEDIKSISAFKSLFLSSILYGLAFCNGLNTDYKHKIWKKQPIKSKFSTNIYEAIECNLVFKEGEKYILLSLKPSLWVDNKNSIAKDELLKISMNYLNPLYNGKYDEKLAEWEKILFGNKKYISFNIPLNTQNDFIFTVGGSRAFALVSVLDINYKPYQYRLNDFNKKSILYKGVQLLEPQLEFINSGGLISKDYHPMRGLINHKPYDSTLNGSMFFSSINVGVICPNSASIRFYDFLNKLNKIIKAEANSDYVIDYNGFFDIYNTNINIPNTESDRWSVIDEKQLESYKLAQDICKKIEALSSNHVGIVIAIFIPRQWEKFRSFKQEEEEFDLHDYIKAFSAQRNITTQIIEESTLNNINSYCQIFWWLSLAFYVKSMRTPWILANMPSNTAFAGIGYSIKKSPSGKNEIVLGCSHIYNAKGEGLKYKLSKVEHPLFDSKKNPFLTYDEAFKLGVSIRELFLQSMNELPKRVVVHKRTPFREDEIKGITDALKSTGIEDVDLIEVNIEESFRFLSQKINYGNIETDGFPLSRGTCIQVAPYQALLWTHGIVPSVRNNNYKYYSGGRSIPAPLKIVKHYGKGDLYTIANEILGFTKMNWNSFNLYTKLPATLDSSAILAKVGKLLSKYEGKAYDYRYFI